jgi:predicted dehydrogenase
MVEALFSFLGGSVFRMIWGEVSSWYNKKQDHQFEIERMRLQADLEDKAHERMQASLRLQSELGIKTIEAQAEAAALTADAEAFANAMKDAFKPTGVYWVDVWNGIIRPSAATIALGLWVLKLNTQSWTMQDWDLTLTGTVLGFFFASRELAKRGR